jgi:heme/copper-type cytochrome/quinol oxidase subunit 2
MTETKKSISKPELLQIIGYIMCLYVTFMGLNYWFNGNLLISTSISLVTLLIIFILVFYLTKWKAAKQTNIHLEKNRTKEIVLFSLYVALAIAMLVPQLHCMIIDFYKKNEIKASGTGKIAEITNLQKQYKLSIEEKVNKFTIEVNTARAVLKINQTSGKTQLINLLGVGSLNFSNNVSTSAFEDQYQAALNNKIDILKKKYNLDSLNKATSKYIEEAKPVFDNWEYTKIGYYSSDIEKVKNNYLQKAISTMEDFKFDTPNTVTLHLDEPANNLKSTPIFKVGLLILCALLMHLLLLSPYIAAQRQYGALKPNSLAPKNAGNEYNDGHGIDISKIK